MTTEDKTQRAAEIDAAIKAVDEEKARKDAEAAATPDPMTQIMDALGGICKRLDALEARKPDRSATSDEEDRLLRERSGATPPTFADSIRRDACLKFQAQADRVALLSGERAPPAMMGESPADYRIRLLRGMQHHSKEFRDVDLRSIADPSILDGIEVRVIADATAAANAPAVAPGRLMPRERQVGAHTFIDYHGSPSAWMNHFAGPLRQNVTAFHVPQNARG